MPRFFRFSKKQAISFVLDVLCGGRAEVRFEQTLRNATTLQFGTQLPIDIGDKHGRLDLCLYGDDALLLVVENEVVPRKGRGADSGHQANVGKQLAFYSQWLKRYHRDAGLVLLGIDGAPDDFLENQRTYPVRLKWACLWTQVHDWIRETRERQPLPPQVSVTAEQFQLFLEEKDMSDISDKQFALLRSCTPLVHDYLFHLDGKL